MSNEEIPSKLCHTDVNFMHSTDDGISIYFCWTCQREVKVKPKVITGVIGMTLVSRPEKPLQN